MSRTRLLWTALVASFLLVGCAHTVTVRAPVLKPARVPVRAFPSLWIAGGVTEDETYVLDQLAAHIAEDGHHEVRRVDVGELEPARKEGRIPAATVVVLVELHFRTGVQSYWDDAPVQYCGFYGCSTQFQSYLTTAPELVAEAIVTVYEGPTARVLQRLPAREHLLAVPGLFVAEDVRMTAHELLADGSDHVVDAELLARELCLKHDLKHQVAKLFAQVRHVLAVDGVNHLVGLFDYVRPEGLEGLFAIPRTALGSQELLHDGDELGQRLSALGHGVILTKPAVLTSALRPFGSRDTRPAMLLSHLRGQNTAVSVLERALTRQRLAHAYLFEGPSGVGKERAAMGLAKAALCLARPGKGCDHCGVCARVDAGNHPDVRVFRPRAEGHRNIQVETLRQDILPVAQFAPFEGQSAFLIFPDADLSFPLSHPESANALLKTLEEPRPHVHFVLLSERAEQLLVTIRSRCQRVRFGRLPPLVLEHVLETAGVPQAQWETAVALSEGRADRALALAQDGHGKHLLERALRIDACLELGLKGRLIELSEELSKADDLMLVLDMLITFYRDVAASALSAQPSKLMLREAQERVQAQAAKLGPARAAARAQKLAEVAQLTARNANTQIVLDHLLLELRTVS